MPKARPKVQSNSVGFGLRAPRVGRRPSAQARRFYEPQKQSPFTASILRNAFSAATSEERILRPRRPVKDAVRPLRIRGLRADRCHEDLAIRSRPKTCQKLPNPPPLPNPKLGPARQENRIRFSRLKNKHSPKLAPVLRPVSASLRLRCRSAAFSRALRDSSIFGSPPK